MALTKILTEGIKDGEILNVDINANASIAKSKLASLDIVNTDVNASAGIVSTKLAKPIDFADNEKARFGTGNDLEIYHNGSTSHINNTTGSLLIGTNDEFQVLNYQENEYRIRAHNNGGVDLYYDNTKRFETSSIGATVTGNLVVDAPDNVTSIGGDWALKLQGGDTNNDLVNLRFATAADGSLAQVSALAEITGSYPNSSGALILSVQAGGASYEAMRINSARKVLIGTTTKGHSAADDLTISSAGDMGITLRSTDSGQGAVYFSDGTSGADEYRGIINYNHGSNFFSIFTDSTEKVRIHSAGQIQLGGTSLSSISSFADDLVLGQSGSTAISGLTFCSTNSSGIRFHDTADAGELEFNHSDDSFTTSASALLKYRTNSAERMRINSAGQILSGITSANVGDANAIFAGGGNAGTNNYGKIYLSAAETNPGPNTALSFIGTSTNNVSNNAMAFIGVHSDGQHASNDYPTRIGFFTTNAGASGATEKLRIHSGGTVNIPGGLTLGQSVTSTAAGNTLDDYEEGTYTPTFSTGMSGITYTIQYGNYVKIGKLVRFDFHIQVNGGVSNAAIIAFTLPFNSDAGVNGHRGSGVITYSNINDGNQGTNGFPALYIGTSSAQCYMGGTAWTGNSGSSQSNKYFIGGGTYHTP